ncbi:MAG: hypothetical protein ACPLPR_07420 [Bacillota bacterium]
MAKVAAELLCEQTVFFDTTHYVKMALVVGEREVRESLGQDQFACEGAVLPGGRFAGTGRHSVIRHGDYLAGNGLGQVNAAKARVVEVGDFDSVPQIRVETNVVLDPGEFRQWFSVRVTKLDGKNIDVREVPLRCPLVKIDWPSRGTYLIHIPGAHDFSEGFWASPSKEQPQD